MKKILISLVILLIFAAVIYILGLVQLAVPGGAWGVIETKTSGIEDTVIEGGKWAWTWRWEKVLPTVMKIHIFRPQVYKANLDNPIQGQVFPSAADYRSALEGNPDFAFEIYYYVEFSVLPPFFPHLIKQGITPATMDTWSLDISKKLGERISRIILAETSLLYDKAFESIMKSKLEDDTELSMLQIIRLVPQPINLPDYDMYLLAKENYFKLQELSFKIREQKIQQDLEKLQREHARDLAAIAKEIEIINNIDKYGTLLNQYPVLIQFLYMRNIKEEDFLKLSQFRLQGEE